MATYYVYVLQIWLRLRALSPEREWLADLQEYLVEEYGIHRIYSVDDSESIGNGDRTVSLQLQITFEESETDEGEPTDAALYKLHEELKEYLEAKYQVSYLSILDDALTSYLLAKEEVAESRQYPAPKQRELTNEEKSQLRTRIEKGDTDIYLLATEFGCSASQVAGIKAALNR